MRRALHFLIQQGSFETFPERKYMRRNAWPAMPSASAPAHAPRAALSRPGRVKAFRKCMYVRHKASRPLSQGSDEAYECPAQPHPAGRHGSVLLARVRDEGLGQSPRGSFLRPSVSAKRGRWRPCLP